MNYRGIDIRLQEAPEFAVRVTPVGAPEARAKYALTAGERLIFAAYSKFGRCYALTSEQVLADAKSMIDANLQTMNPSSL